MVDSSRRIDLSGNDLLVNSIAFAPAGSVSSGGSQGQIVIDINGTTPVTVAGTTATLTLANLAAGYIYSTNAGATTLTLDTAANYVAALASQYSGVNFTTTAGTSINFTVYSRGAGGATVALGTGGTFVNASTGTVATGTFKTFLIQFTSNTAYNVYS